MAQYYVICIYDVLIICLLFVAPKQVSPVQPVTAWESNVGGSRMARGLWPEPPSLIFTDQSDGENAKQTKESREDFAKFYLPS